MNEQTPRHLAARRGCVGRPLPSWMSKDLRQHIKNLRGQSFDEGYQQAIDEQEAEMAALIEEAIEWA